MTCQDRDPDLLLFSLGELSRWQRWKVARHLGTCRRCRARQQELAAVSRHIGDIYRPPADGNGRPGGPGIAVSAPLLRQAFSPLILALLLGVLAIGVVSLWYLRPHHGMHPVVAVEGCRPDLPSDKCR